MTLNKKSPEKPGRFITDLQAKQLYAELLRLMERHGVTSAIITTMLQGYAWNHITGLKKVGIKEIRRRYNRKKNPTSRFRGD
jgi:hypothetical protein